MSDCLATKGTNEEMKINFSNNQYHRILHASPGGPGIHCVSVAFFNPNIRESLADPVGPALVDDIMPDCDARIGFLDKEISLFVPHSSVLHLPGLVCHRSMILLHLILTLFI